MRENQKSPTTFLACLPGRVAALSARPWRSAAAAFAVLLGATVIGACSRGRVEAQAGSGLFVSSPAANEKPQFFTLPAEQMAHVRIVPVKTANLPRVLRLPGTVAYNAFATTPVITQVSGPVARILVYPGQQVKENQPMLYVSSPDYAQLRTNYLKARDAYLLAQKNYQRSQDLYSHHAIATRDLEAALSAMVQANADLDAALQALRVLGVPQPEKMTVGSSSPVIPVLAPIAGEVVERLVSPGQVIQGGATQCFTISDMSSVWVMASVFQSDLGAVRVGNAVTIRADAYPGHFRGRISYIAPALDPNTRTLQVRIVTSNPGEKLRKDMYVTVTVNAGEVRGALVVPDAAVMRNSENQPFVYVDTGNSKFAERLVTIGAAENGYTEILEGVSANQQVVADGSLFLQFANSFQR